MTPGEATLIGAAIGGTVTVIAAAFKLATLVVGKIRNNGNGKRHHPYEKASYNAKMDTLIGLGQESLRVQKETGRQLAALVSTREADRERWENLKEALRRIEHGGIAE